MYRSSIVAVLILVLALAAGSPAVAQTSCTASSSWVNNPTLPTSLDESNQCNFQIFSWQSFLALMQPANSNQLVFETWMSSDGMFPPDGQKPLPWGQTPWPPTLGSVTKQAGSSNDLFAQSGAEVQYDLAVNQAMYNYINSNMLYNATCFNAGGNNVHMPPAVDPDTNPQSIELKVAWLPMSSCDSTKYHCVKALVNGQPTSVGLIGFHVVHKLPDHQEWIWSTFEHVANSPDCAQISNPPSGYSSWNFFKTGFVPVGKPCSACASEDGSGCDPTTQCNTYVSETSIPNICRTQQLSTLQCNPSGGLNDDVNDVVCLNQSVWSLLPANSVWRNYMLVGTVWFKPGMSAPDNSGQVPPTGQAFTGNTNLSNTVMETYTQQANANCLSAGCHTSAFKSISTTGSAGHADFSHMFSRIQAFQQVTCPTIVNSQSSHGSKETVATAPVKLKSSHGPSGSKKK